MYAKVSFSPNPPPNNSFNPTAHSAALINIELGGGLIRALGRFMA
jgi:hypothetical protein